MQHLIDLIPAAAQWLLITDGFIFMCDPFPSVQNIARDGTLWMGMHGFGEERWIFWKERMVGMDGMDELKYGNRKIAENL